MVRQHEDRVVVRGLSPQKPFHGSSLHGPGPPPNMLRPMTVAPMFSNQPSTIGLLAFTSPPSMPCIGLELAHCGTPVSVVGLAAALSSGAPERFGGGDHLGRSRGLEQCLDDLLGEWVVSRPVRVDCGSELVLR